MKKILKLSALILLIIMIVGISGILYLSNGLKDGETVSVTDVEIDSIKDGEYEGTYENKRWNNKVKVKIESGTIIDIDIIETVMFEKPEVTESLISQVIDHQSLEIDGVTGATVSVNAYLKAMEDALMKARQ